MAMAIAITMQIEGQRGRNKVLLLLQAHTLTKISECAPRDLPSAHSNLVQDTQVAWASILYWHDFVSSSERLTLVKDVESANSHVVIIFSSNADCPRTSTYPRC